MIALFIMFFTLFNKKERKPYQKSLNFNSLKKRYGCHLLGRDRHKKQMLHFNK